MYRHRRKPFSSFFNNEIISSYLPNKNDNIKQILLKVLFLLAITLLIFSICFTCSVFLKISKQEDIIEDSRNIWNNYYFNENCGDADILSQVSYILSAPNADYSGWIAIENSKIDNPIYKAKNNSYYINNNQNKEPSFYGALHFDSRCKIDENNTDKNLIIYGKSIFNGSMFGELKKLKNISYYNNHSLINFSTKYESATYKIFAVFVMNSKKEDDDGNIFNIYRKNFFNAADFDIWINDAFERSIIDADIDVCMEDNILTLITDDDDFEDARLVVMARKLRDGNDVSVSKAKPKTNPNPKYPKKWYTSHGIS